MRGSWARARASTLPSSATLSVLPRVAMGSSAGYRLRLGAIVVLGMRTLALLPALAMARTVCAASSRLGREMSSE